jgi:hypothetical protein
MALERRRESRLVALSGTDDRFAETVHAVVGGGGATAVDTGSRVLSKSDNAYHVATFEDAVIFVHDVERALSKLDPFSQKLVAKIVLQEYSAGSQKTRRWGQ